MSDKNNDNDKDVTLSLKAMVDKERNKVLFAVADNDFADILLSFLTLPLGRIVKILDKHCRDEAATTTIGSLSNLRRSLAGLDGANFVTEGAKNTLLNPTSLFEDEYKMLKLDFTDSPPAEEFKCFYYAHNTFRSVSLYYDDLKTCRFCAHQYMRKVVVEKGREAGSSDGVLTIRKSSFTISDDLQIFPNEMGLLPIITVLGITDLHKAEEIQVELGFTEIVNLLKASLTSPTPLSDIILNKTTKVEYSPIMEPQPQLEKDENPEFKYLTVKAMIQKSSGKLVYAQAKEDFIEFLLGLLLIPLGGAVHLLGGQSFFKPINNLYRGTACLIQGYFESPNTKTKLINPILPHGSISENQILPLVEENLPADYTYNRSYFSSVKFPKGEGTYLVGPRTYKVTDDLTVTPFCAASILSTLKNLEIPISDVEEVEMRIGLKEGLRILKASLTSTSALSDVLLNPTPMKKPKREQV